MKITLNDVVLLGRRKGKTIVGPMNLQLTPGLIGLAGPNDAGKSSLVKLLAGIYAPSSGTIEYDIRGTVRSSFAAKLHIGYVPQNISLYEDFTVRKFLAYIAGLKCIREDKVEAEIRRVSALWHLDRLLDQRLSSCSGGEQRLAMIAQAFLGAPSFLLLDEPFTWLDHGESERLAEILRDYARRCIVVVVSHLAERSSGDYDRLLIMRDGTIHREADKSSLPGELSMEEFYFQRG